MGIYEAAIFMKNKPRQALNYSSKNNKFLVKAIDYSQEFIISRIIHPT